MKECPACRRCFPDDVDHCPNDGDATVPSITGEPILDSRYQLERRLGQGGMGAVFQARHIFLKTFHAIKIILPDLVGNDPMLVTRFRQEAMAAAAIHHQNIIAVTDFGVVRGTTPFLVMEFVKGRSLHDLLAEEKRLTPERALELMSPICAGMAAAHRQNIVHRDLKPLNILLQDEAPFSEGLKICDFGLAKIKSGELLGSFVQAKTSGLMGSPFYMAPEQWSDEEPDVRADIYSLGVILYQMLGGDVPFKGSSVPAIMKKHLTLEPPPLKSLGADVPPQIEAVMRHALEKEADKRPSSVTAFLNELKQAVADTAASLHRTQIDFISPDSQTIISVPRHSQEQQAGTIVRVHTNPPQSSVFIDNIYVGVSDNTGELVVPEQPEGLHSVRVAHQGYADWEQQIECNGRDCHVNAHLQDSLNASQPRLTGDPLAGTITGEALNISAHEVNQSSAKLPERAGTGQLKEAEAVNQDVEEKERQPSTSAPVTGEHTTRQTTPIRTTPLDSYLVTRVMENQDLPEVGPQVGGGQARAEAVVDKSEDGREKKKSSLPLVLAAVVVLLLAGVGIGAYFLFVHKPAPTVAQNVGPQNKPEEKPPVAKAEMLSIPGGTFQMGRSDGLPQETPPHTVTVGPFFMDKTEVTNADYAQFVQETKHAPPDSWGGDKPPAGQEQWPVSDVSFDDAQAFAAWRSKRDGFTYRLPTEEEWEYAARNGEQDNLYPWGNNWIEGYAVTKEAGIVSPQPVGSSQGDKTRWGVFGLIGNVREWTSSKASFYPGNKNQVPAQTRDWIVVRGGSFVSDHKQIPISGTYRDWFAPTTKHPTIGFRLVRAGS